MKRCKAYITIPAVRGQLDEKGKPVMVKVQCNGEEGHGGLHWNGVEGSASDGIHRKFTHSWS